MTMFGAGILIVVIAFAVVGLLWVLPLYRRLHGTRTLTCPETQEEVGVSIDAGHAAATAWGGEIHLKLKDCARWPERAGCAQGCLSQVRT